jgi:hypothetical protein
MALARTRADRALAAARCRGFLAVASDGPLGEVEAPLFPPGGEEPDYLVVRMGGVLRRRRPVIATQLVEDIDPGRGLVFLSGRGEELARLPEYLPLAG